MTNWGCIYIEVPTIAINEILFIQRQILMNHRHDKIISRWGYNCSLPACDDLTTGMREWDISLPDVITQFIQCRLGGAPPAHHHQALWYEWPQPHSSAVISYQRPQRAPAPSSRQHSTASISASEAVWKSPYAFYEYPVTRALCRYFPK